MTHFPPMQKRVTTFAFSLDAFALSLSLVLYLTQHGVVLPSPMISSSSEQPSSSSSSSSVLLPSSSSAFPCCSSSSSDEAETDIRGWPSIGNVLETPDRRRMRKTWRSVAIRVDLNKIPKSIHHLSSNIQRPLPAIISRSQHSTFSPNKRNNSLRLPDNMASSADCSPNGSKGADAKFTSPPLMRRLPHSPDLRTPKAYNNSSQPRHIHLSVSPMSAFFFRQRLNAEDDPGSDCSPKCASSSSFSVLRPLNFQNYIGIRFSGEQPKRSTESQPFDSNSKSGGDTAASSSSPLTDENSFVVPKRGAQPRSSSSSSVSLVATKRNSSANNDSGFLDCSALSSVSVVETPSKGQSVPHHSCNGSSLSASSASLFIGFDHLLHPHNATHPTSAFTSTTSTIPEQSYGPLEASVMDGILKDLSQWASTDAKTPEQRASPQRRSLLFERKLRALEIGRREETTAPNAEILRGIPSELVLEMGELAEEVTLEQLRLLLPDLDQCSAQLMFGLSSDQLELTQMAHSFIPLYYPQRILPSIGSLGDCVTEWRVKLD